MPKQFLYFWIDDRGRIAELRVTRRGEGTEEPPPGRYGRGMTRDLSGSYLRLDDLPSAYADPVRDHIRRTGEQQGIVEIQAELEEPEAPEPAGDGATGRGEEARER